MSTSIERAQEIDNPWRATHNRQVRHQMPLFVLLLLVLGAITVPTAPAAAQGCAMCQTVFPNASEPIARGMFWCVLLLLTAPFAVSCTIGGWLFYQYWRYQRTGQKQEFTAEVISFSTTKDKQEKLI